MDWPTAFAIVGVSASFAAMAAIACIFQPEAPSFDIDDDPPPPDAEKGGA